MTTLLVASTGGHLKQLHLLHRRLGLSGPFHWVTFDRPQSRSLLSDRGEAVDYVRPIGSRDPLGALAGLRDARRVLRAVRPTAIVSTGSAIALPYMTLGRARGIPCRYVESAARTDGPSMTGRMLSAVPGIDLQTQYASWADRRWRHGQAVFDVFAAQPATEPAVVRRIVVALGTLKFDFSRLVDRLGEIVPDDVEVTWQLGETPARPGMEHAVQFMPERELVALMQDADVVVAHAGVGSALSALETGRVPVLVPRRSARGEHVDDHQEQIARELSRRGLAVEAEADALTWDDLLRAASARVSVDRG